jgi:hypothetical protein
MLDHMDDVGLFVAKQTRLDLVALDEPAIPRRQLQEATVPSGAVVREPRRKDAAKDSAIPEMNVASRISERRRVPRHRRP